VFDTDAEATPASTEVALAEVLQSGVTTLVDLCSPFDGWIDLIVAQRSACLYRTDVRFW